MPKRKNNFTVICGQMPRLSFRHLSHTPSSHRLAWLPGRETVKKKENNDGVFSKEGVQYSEHHLRILIY